MRAKLFRRGCSIRRGTAVPGTKEPVTQFAFLTTREASHVTAGRRALLNKRECLQDGVVQVCGDLCALGFALAPCALGNEFAVEPEQPRGDREGDASEHREGGHHDSPGARLP